MFFLVCFRCIEVFTQEEGHCCPFSEGNEGERNSADVVLVRAEPAELRKDSTAITKAVACKTDSKNSRSTRGGLKFSVVASGTGGKTINNNKATRTENADNFPPLTSDLRNALAVSYTPSAFPENAAHYLRQSTRSEINKFTSTISKCIAKYPKVSQQTSLYSRQSACNEYHKYASTLSAHTKFQTAYKDGYYNEFPRTKNIQNLHALKPRYAIPQYDIPRGFPEKIAQDSRQYTHTQHGIHNNAVNLRTHTAVLPTVFQQAAHFSRQSAWNECNKYAFTQGTHTEELRAVPNIADHSPSLQKEAKDGNNTLVQDTQILGSLNNEEICMSKVWERVLNKKCIQRSCAE